jgi:predicted sulfurtransferase
VDPNPARWYWTPARRGHCHRCGRDVCGELIAYSFEDRTAYCARCADRLGIAAKARESKRARRARHERLIEEAERVALAGTA